MSVLLLLDTSGSMYGEKIKLMQQAATDLLSGLKNILPDLPVGIITFGDTPTLQPFAPVGEIVHAEYEAGGKSAFHEALTFVESIKPDSVILISDGICDGIPIEKIEESAAKYAISIGYDADLDMLARFAGSRERLFSAYDAGRMAGFLAQTLLANNVINERGE